MTKEFFNDPTYKLVTAYIVLKRYEGIPDNEMAPLRRRLAGRVRNILRLWGNVDWK